MTNVIERAADLLFPQSGPATLNVKFFCGGVVNASAEQLAEEIVRAETQISAGRARLVANVDAGLTIIPA